MDVEILKKMLNSMSENKGYLAKHFNSVAGLTSTNTRKYVRYLLDMGYIKDISTSRNYKQFYITKKGLKFGKELKK